MDLAEAAQYLALPMRTVSRLVTKGEIHATGWPMRIRWSDLEDFLRRSRIKPGQLRHLYQVADEDA